MIVGLVCARLGSEGLPGKNFAGFAGKPLIDWSIEQAVTAKKLDGVYVVTDAPYQYPGVETIHEPRHLAGAGIAKWQVWQWAAAQLESQGREVTAVVDIDVTRPLRHSADIDKVIKRYLAPPPDSHVVMGISEAKRSPYFDILEMDQTGLHISKPLGRFSVRQYGPKVYNHAGVYVIHRDSLYRQLSLFEPGQLVQGVLLSAENAIDIDNELDWRIAEYLMERRILEAANIKAAERWQV